MQWKVKVLHKRMPSIKKAEIGNISCALADSLSRTRNDNSSTKKQYLIGIEINLFSKAISHFIYLHISSIYSDNVITYITIKYVIQNVTYSDFINTVLQRFRRCC